MTVRALHDFVTLAHDQIFLAHVAAVVCIPVLLFAIGYALINRLEETL